MNRIAATLEQVYADGFHHRLLLLKHAARKFAATASWCDEHSCYDGDPAAIEALMVAAIEMWWWEKLHDGCSLGIRSRTAGACLANGIVMAARNLGDATYKGQDATIDLKLLLSIAVYITTDEQREKRHGRVEEEGR